MNLTVKRLQMVILYSAAHFLVDFACAFLMFRYIAETPDWYFCILLYNFFAFAMQMPLGILVDKLNRNHLFAAFGCILVGVAYGLCRSPYAAVAVVGAGNALFHLGGGVDVLNISGEKSGALGLFVSPGAFGVYFGTMLGKNAISAGIPIPAALFVAAALIIFARRMRVGVFPGNAEFSLDASTQPIIAAVCLFLVVCLRSYTGLAIQFPWKGIGYWGIALVSAVVLGKAAGGFLADKFGKYKISCLSLGFAAFLFLIPQIPVAGVFSMLLFNMTMPITLWAMARIFPGAKGFSFGLLTFGLFLGFLPVYLGASVPPGVSWLFAPSAALSLALLLFGLRKTRSLL
ncbi:MAG: hypothetical protein LBH28_00980 [Oscillospiraceae bacterium]|nr:hypothetical protein [Oscillospiraceae bacterium]